VGLENILKAGCAGYFGNNVDNFIFCEKFRLVGNHSMDIGRNKGNIWCGERKGEEGRENKRLRRGKFITT
jgi:hypothetical protein